MDLREILSHLQYFYIVAKEKNFSKAADIMHLSVTSVRYHVKSLEEKLNVELISKKPNKKINNFLTKEGERIFDECQIVFNYSDEAIDKILDEEKKSHFLVTAPISFGMRLLMPAITYISQNFNGFYCGVNLTNNIIDIVDNNVDIAIRNVVPLDDSNIAAEKLMYSKTVAIVSREYLLNAGGIKSIYDIKNHNIITFKEKDHNWEKIKGFYTDIEMPPYKNIITISDNNSIIEAVRDGVGIGLVPMYELDKYNLEMDNIEYVLEDYINCDKFDLMHTIYVCYLKFNIKSDTIKEFIKYFKVFLRNKNQLVIENE